MRSSGRTRNPELSVSNSELGNCGTRQLRVTDRLLSIHVLSVASALLFIALVAIAQCAPTPHNSLPHRMKAPSMLVVYAHERATFVEPPTASAERTSCG